MSWQAWAQAASLLGLVGLSTPLLGAYIARVFDGCPAPGDRIFSPVERALYRLGGIDPEREQPWSVYALSMLAFSCVSVLGLFLLQRVQGALPLNPTHVGSVAPALAFNTAVSFVTNTNWQSYGGESTMSHLTQMAGLTVQNFVSAAVGIAVAIAVVRGITRRRSETIGNFWADLTRATTRILLPLALVLALVLAGLGVVQTLSGPATAHTVAGATQEIFRGPVASQEAIKELGTNGGGPLGANSAHPFENPTGLTNLVEMWALLAIPFALTFAFGRLVGDRRQGWAIFAAMLALWAGSAALATWAEVGGNPQLHALGAVGANMEGKEVRFGAPASALFAASTTGTSAGAVDSSHDSFTPLGGAVPLVNMMLGEVSPGGVGSGLYGMLVFALLAVFMAGLMVGRTPEYLGKKIQAAEMKLVVLYLLAVPALVLTFAGVSVVLDSATRSILDPGPHGLSEIVYAFTSASNNNGSAFGGLSANTDWLNTTLGLAMLGGRFLLIVPALAIAGSLARKQYVPATAGTLPTGTPLFAGLLVGVVLIVVGLTYFPVLSLGPTLEHLGQ
ncbi:MAG: potassium-transporting ATPase subunit KdpA [Gaiella sp.]|uniref:potassium-transporting ATPase subunit KdpA n=1 Tax=Gaiella sp. TaxID=2663207 RepID=UPI003C747587